MSSGTRPPSTGTSPPGRASSNRSAFRAGPGPWIVQEYIEGPGFDLKVYGVGDRLAARRTVFTPGVFDAPREPFRLEDPAIARWSREAALACRLVCFGIDFILSPDGPVIVDVNAFPGYRGVLEAVEWLAAAVRAELRARSAGGIAAGRVT
jgi:glutathione synthase/RimK-type ligase-like ATP-grasp enzyme